MSGSGFSNKVLVATLWQRTSDKGNEYLSVQPGKEQEACAGGGEQQTAAPRPGRSPAPTGAKPKPAAEPFYDDPIGDIGRAR